ncbi:MAG TPA: hypothetical protein VIX41_07875 [Acidimicrobiales bacterium]
MLHTIVEGEPGIFPAPVARVMRKIGGWFDRRKPAEPADTTPTPPTADDSPTAPSADDRGRPPDAGDHSGESR